MQYGLRRTGRFSRAYTMRPGARRHWSIVPRLLGCFVLPAVSTQLGGESESRDHVGVSGHRECRELGRWVCVAALHPGVSASHGSVELGQTLPHPSQLLASIHRGLVMGTHRGLQRRKERSGLSEFCCHPPPQFLKLCSPTLISPGPRTFP